MVAKPKVLITGASGLIGSLVIRDLSDKYDFSGLSRRPVAGIVHTQADITDPAAMRKAAAGMDMVLHLAAETQDYDNWDKVMANTISPFS
jgi:nucleoside-diphosphate-sugar epimerase